MKLPKDKYIVLFDGVCNLCHKAVQVILKNDKSNKFVFASLQSEIGIELLNERQINPETTDSIVLIKPGEAYFIKSDAALEIAKDLKGLYPVMSLCSVLPLKLRDLIYDFIAKNRYKLFGKKEVCPLPDPSTKNKFL